MFAEDPIIGLLASLGLPALEKLSDLIIRSKKVTKLFNPDYIYNIYDFKDFDVRDLDKARTKLYSN